jgi:hypothetical protein
MAGSQGSGTDPGSRDLCRRSRQPNTTARSTGRESLRGVHGGGVSELRRGLHVGGGESYAVPVAEVIDSRSPVDSRHTEIALDAIRQPLLADRRIHGGTYSVCR